MKVPAVLSHGSEAATLVMSCTLLLTALMLAQAAKERGVETEWRPL